MSPVSAPVLQDCLDRVAAAKYLNISPATLAAWATSGRHRETLRPFRLGKRVWYSRKGSRRLHRIADVILFVRKVVDESAARWRATSNEHPTRRIRYTRTKQRRS